MPPKPAVVKALKSAKAALEIEDYQAAYDFCKEALEHAKDSFPACVGMGTACLNLGKVRPPSAACIISIVSLTPKLRSFRAHCACSLAVRRMRDRLAESD